MHKSKQFLFLILLCLLLAGCSGKKEENAISLMYLSELDTEYQEMVNAPTDKFLETLDAWEAQHPYIPITEKPRHYTSDISALANLGEEHLPDVFITDCLTGRLLSDNEMVMDLSPYMENTNNPDLKPYTYGGEICAFPAVLQSFTVIAYDQEAWKTAGYEAFPETFESLEKAARTLKKNNPNYSTILGIGNSNGVPASRDLLSILLSDREGQEWFSTIRGTEKAASFTDGFFIERMTILKDILESDVFSGQEGMDTKTTINAFSKGECPAVMLNGVDVLRILETVREKNPELYRRIHFAAFPWKGTQVMPAGWNYGLFINARLKEDPEKLEKCIELCRALAWTETSLDETDETLDRLVTFQEKVEICPICTQYLVGVFWSDACNSCFKYLTEEPDPKNTNRKTIREYAAGFQNIYEEYYLNIEDYSDKIRQFAR